MQWLADSSALLMLVDKKSLLLYRPDGTIVEDFGAKIGTQFSYSFGFFNQPIAKNGSRIAVISTKIGADATSSSSQTIHLLNVDGSEVKTIPIEYSDKNPFGTRSRDKIDILWSPDGTRLAFRAGGEFLDTVRADGSERVTLFRSQANQVLDLPRWLDNGQTLVFSVADDNDTDLSNRKTYLANADGSGVVAFNKVEKTSDFTPLPGALAPSAGWLQMETEGTEENPKGVISFYHLMQKKRVNLNQPPIAVCP